MKTYDLLNFPEIRTTNLLLKKLSVHEASTIHELRKDPDIAARTGRAASTGLEDAQGFIHHIEKMIANQECIYWSIFLQQNAGLAGTICLWHFDQENETAEMGYELLPGYQGKGLMQEAVEAVLTFGFEQMQLKNITAFPSAKNPASITLLEKFHFKPAKDLHSDQHEEVPGLLTYTLNESDHRTKEV